MARTLSEVYAGMLSRDWDTLLKILEGGENRLHFYRYEVASGRYAERLESAHHTGGSFLLCGLLFDKEFTKEDIKAKLLDRNSIGWLPAPGDNPKDVMEDVNATLRDRLPAKIKHLKGE